MSFSRQRPPNLLYCVATQTRTIIISNAFPFFHSTLTMHARHSLTTPQHQCTTEMRPRRPRGICDLMSSSFLAACAIRRHDAATVTLNQIATSSTLFVGCLPLDVTDAELGAYFRSFGEVCSSPVVLHRGTQRSRGFGFVTFAVAESAAAALPAVHILRGQTLAVRVSEAHNPEWVRPVRVRHRKRVLVRTAAGTRTPQPLVPALTDERPSCGSHLASCGCKTSSTWKTSDG